MPDTFAGQTDLTIATPGGTMASKRVGILTAGGDSPGLNAAIRGFGKTAIHHYGMELVGFRDGITGLVNDNYTDLDSSALSGILTIGGTILGTSRESAQVPGRW